MVVCWEIVKNITWKALYSRYLVLHFWVRKKLLSYNFRPPWDLSEKTQLAGFCLKGFSHIPVRRTWVKCRGTLSLLLHFLVGLVPFDTAHCQTTLHALAEEVGEEKVEEDERKQNISLHFLIALKLSFKPRCSCALSRLVPSVCMLRFHASHNPRRPLETAVLKCTGLSHLVLFHWVQSQRRSSGLLPRSVSEGAAITLNKKLIKQVCRDLLKKVRFKKKKKKENKNVIRPGWDPAAGSKAASRWLASFGSLEFFCTCSKIVTSGQWALLHFALFSHLLRTTANSVVWKGTEMAEKFNPFFFIHYFVFCPD